MEITPIAYIKTPFKEKFGVPRQGGLISSVQGEIHFEKACQNPDFIRGIEGFDYLWLIWGFDQAKSDNITPTVRPPRLGGGQRMGVFATRSPFRPNKLGLSAVKLEGVTTDQYGFPILKVSNVDMVDHTPIFDIKPYSREVDAYPNAKNGFIEEATFSKLKVRIDEVVKIKLTQKEQLQIEQILALDPRPAYQRKADTNREYGMSVGRWNIRFRVIGEEALVFEASSLGSGIRRSK